MFVFLGTPPPLPEKKGLYVVAFVRVGRPMQGVELVLARDHFGFTQPNAKLAATHLLYQIDVAKRNGDVLNCLSCPIDMAKRNGVALNCLSYPIDVAKRKWCRIQNHLAYLI